MEPIGDPSYTGKRHLCLHAFDNVCEKLIVWCFKMVVIDSKSFCYCMQSDFHVISLWWNNAGRGISRSNFFDIFWDSTSYFHIVIFLLDWNVVSLQQMQHQGTVSILIFPDIPWLLLKECFYDLIAINISTVLSLQHQIC